MKRDYTLDLARLTILAPSGLALIRYTAGDITAEEADGFVRQIVAELNAPKLTAKVRDALGWMLAESFDLSGARLDDLDPTDGREELDALEAVQAWASDAGIDTKWIDAAMPSEAARAELRAKWDADDQTPPVNVLAERKRFAKVLGFKVELLPAAAGHDAAWEVSRAGLSYGNQPTEAEGWEAAFACAVRLNESGEVEPV